MAKMTIEIDYSKCKAPEECRRCVSICPPVVLSLSFKDKDFHNPQDWIIVPIFPGLCTNCGLCVEECSEKAIKVYH